MKLLFCGSGWPSIVDEIGARLDPGAEVRRRDFDRPLAAQVDDVDVILPSNARVDREVVAAAKRLRLIQQPAVGYEGIDVDAARERRIPVCNAPGVNGQAVAEAALLLLLSLARRVPAARRQFAAAKIGEPVGVELGGKTLLLVGAGRSGSRLRAAAEGIGMRVLVARSSTTRVELHALLAQGDYVSIHCPLNESTRGLFDSAAFAAMKPGASLVNCARGAIVDRDALVSALDAGRLGGVGLDVHWREPWDPSDPLFARDDVVTLPHIGGSTREAFGAIAEVVVENLRRLSKGEPLLHRVA